MLTGLLMMKKIDRFGVVVTAFVNSTKLLYACPGTGGRVRIQLLVRKIYLCLTNHSGQLSLAIPCALAQ